MTTDVAADARRPRATTWNLLFVVSAGATPTGALVCAYRLATEMLARLHVLRVVPLDAPFPRGGASDDLASLVVASQEVRSTRAWCDRALPERLPPSQLVVRVGAFQEALAARARELRAGLVVLPPDDFAVEQGRLLNRASSVPVLILPELDVASEGAGLWPPRCAV